MLIDHVVADHAVATWLARRLSLAGFRTWCRGTAPLAGEDDDESVRKLLDTRTNHYLPIISNSSLSDGVFLERCTIAAMKEDSVLPCCLVTPDSRLSSRLTKLVPADFKNSWSTGLNQVIARLTALGIKPSLDPDRGRQIALRDYLPTQVITAKPEPVFANVFPLQLPMSMLIFDLQRPLTETEKVELGKQWAFTELSALKIIAFTHPSLKIPAVKVGRIPEFSWTDISHKSGKKTLDLAKELARRSLEVVCVQKGLQYCDDRKVFYFPKQDTKEWNQSIQHVDGRSTTVQLTGTRTKGWGDRASPFSFQLAPRFYPRLDAIGKWSVIVNIYIRVTLLDGGAFEGKEIGRRRKIVSKSWWNKEWLARLLGVVQALQTTEGEIKVGEGIRAVIMQTKPLSWECPVGLDLLALSGVPDIGEEIAEFRTWDNDEELPEIDRDS